MKPSMVPSVEKPQGEATKGITPEREDLAPVKPVTRPKIEAPTKPVQQMKPEAPERRIPKREGVVPAKPEPKVDSEPLDKPSSKGSNCAC